MWEYVWPLHSVQEWFESLWEDFRAKIIWLHLPIWMQPWERGLVDGLYGYLAKILTSLPQIIDFQAGLPRQDALSPFLILRRIILETDTDGIWDINQLVQHPKAPQVLLGLRFASLPHQTQEHWGKAFIRWARAAHENELRRVVFLLVCSPVPQTILHQSEQFVEVVTWSPPYSVSEAQALIEIQARRWATNFFETQWAMHILISMCGQDIFCAHKALEHAQHPRQLSTLEFWKRFLVDYAAKINPPLSETAVEPVLGILGLPEPHPITLLSNHALLQRRIWRAQSRWLMGCVDEIRWSAVAMLGDISREQPYCQENCTKAGEFTCLSCVATQRGKFDLARQLDRTRHIRNDLAHYRPISFKQANYLWKTLCELK